MSRAFDDFSTTNALVSVAVAYAAFRLVRWFRARIRFIRMVNALPGPPVENHKYPITADLGPIFDAPKVSERMQVPDSFQIFADITREFHENKHGLVRQWGFHPYHTPFAQSFVMLMDPSCIQDVLQKSVRSAEKSIDGSKQKTKPAFEKPLDEAYRGVVPLLGPSVLLMPDGHPQWKLQRKAGTATVPIIEHGHESTRNLIRKYLFPRWDKKNKHLTSPTKAKDDHGDDVFYDIKHLTIDAAGMVTISKDFGALEALSKDDEDDTLLKHIMYLATEASHRSRSPLRSIFHFRQFNKSLQKLNDFFASTVGQRKKELAANPSSDEGKDLLSGFLKVEDKLQEGTLLGNLRVNMYGAFDAVSSILTWSLWELAKNSAYQDRLYNDELKSLGANPTYHELSKCDFLNQIVHETLRLYAPTVISRRATRDVTIGKDRYCIPKGCSVFIFPVLVNRLSTPDNPDADKFIPDRAVSQHTKKMKDDIALARNLAFSLTPRSCLGSPLALTEIRTALATIVYSYRIIPVEGAPEPRLILDFNFNPYDVFIRFERREH